MDEFPFKTWHGILARWARNASLREFDYGASIGAKALREAICLYLRRSRAVACEPSQVIVVNGSQQVLDLAARVLLDRGDPVVIEDPHHQGAREIFRAAGARLYPQSVDREGLDPATLPGWARWHWLRHRTSFPPGPFFRSIVALRCWNGPSG